MQPEAKEYRRGSLTRAVEPWPRGQVLTTDPAAAGNPPAGDLPTHVDAKRFASLRDMGLLEEAGAFPAGGEGEGKHPDALGGTPEPDPQPTVVVHEDPPPVPASDPRLREPAPGPDGEKGGAA